MAGGHVEDGSLVLCDLTSVYFEGTMLTDARIREEPRAPRGLRWITSLRAPAIRRLASGGDLQLSIFDEQDLAEVSAPELYPGERLVVCRNPLLAATEVKLDLVVRATQRDNRPLRGEKRIAVRADRALRARKVGKHFKTAVTDDGFCVIRTNVPAGEMGPRRHGPKPRKSLGRVERAFRSFKGVDLKVRPVHHRLADRVRTHIFLCMLACYVEWHMRRAMAPLLFDDNDPAAAEAARASPVAPAPRGPEAHPRGPSRPLMLQRHKHLADPQRTPSRRNASAWSGGGTGEDIGGHG